MTQDHHELEDVRHASLPRESPTAPSTETAPPLASLVGNRAFGRLVQRAELKSQGAGPLDPEIGDEIRHAKGGGQPLDDATRADMEGHLGFDLANVRVHTDSNADRLNRSVQAEAFTTGTDVFFSLGRYDPASTDGRRLLAHELTHVVQQSTGATNGAGRVSHPDDAHEVEAKAVGDAVASAGVSPGTAGPPGVDREEVEDEEVQAAAIQRQGMEEEEELQASAIDGEVDDEADLEQ